MNEEALAIAIKKVRKLRMVGHVAVKDAAPPAITVLALMKSGLGALYEDAALEFMFRRFMTYYEVAESAQPHLRTEPASPQEQSNG